MKKEKMTENAINDEIKEKTVNDKIQDTDLDPDVLENNLARIAYTLDKEYLSHLNDYGVLQFKDYCKNHEIEYKEGQTRNYAAIKVSRFIINKDEKVIDCMKNVIGSFANTSDSIAFLVHRKINEVDIYFIFKKNGNIDAAKTNANLQLLDKSFKGNFQGSKTLQIIKEEKVLNEFKFLENTKHISMLSSIPSDKSESYISQGIEKLMNGFIPENEDDEYSVLVLAESLTQEEIRDVINGFEEMATSITPYASHQFQIGKNDSETQGEMKSCSNTTGISHAISKTHSINIGVNAGLSGALTNGSSHGVADADGENNNVAKSQNNAGIGGSAGALIGGIVGSVVPVLGTTAGAAIGGTVGSLIGNIIGTKTKSSGKSHTHTVTDSTFNSLTKALSIGISGGYGYSWGMVDTTSSSKSLTDGTNHNITIGKNETNILNYKSYQVSDLIKNLEVTIQRLMESKSTGLWKTATYVFSNSGETSRSIVNYLSGLTQGDNSYTEAAKVFDWEISNEKTSAANEIREYLTHFTHPVLVNYYDLQLNQKDQIVAQVKESLKNAGVEDNKAEELSKKIKESKNIDLIPITPTTNISTTELAKIFSLPSHSLPGLSVLECAEFGRNVGTYDDSGNEKDALELGIIWHMNHEENLPVKLNSKSLTSHVFITGSTGSGKSNTVYKLLNEAKKNGTKFLVIEPAKGEYKNVFGGEKDGEEKVTVYGTNPKISELLKINPFSFPIEKVHVLEHMDRLVEIFNVCWPMYAAMPAVLKEAIEKSYEDAGWDLINSVNPNGKEYPTFADVAQNIKIIIDTSEYDAENKGAYKGSLLTRLKSLTNGLNGLIFSSDEIDDFDLFDKNVIIDLSRVGSQETKALLMGVLVLKLQEYRMSSGTEMNANLKHITVLEEAHNLLKRTSTEQSAESANLAGKSVEMLTNAIAEMRTYGEAFFIVDQAPALLDMAVIRNTNTKIIMRLPDLGDRELVGKAANLNDDQISELAKLPTGVAAVYQNQWVEAVLCKVKFENNSKNNAYKDKPETNVNNDKELNKKRIHIAGLLSKGEKLSSSTVADAAVELKSLNISYAVKAIAIEYLTNPPSEPKMTKLAPVMAALFPKAYEATKRTYILNQDNPVLWTNDIINALNRQYLIDKENLDLQLQRDIVQALVTQYVFNEIHQVAKLEEWTKHHGF